MPLNVSTKSILFIVTSSFWWAFVPSSTAAPSSAANNFGMEFVHINAGCFMMGSLQPSQVNSHGQPMGVRSDELPQHEVCVDSFWLATHEVTHNQWQRVMGGDSISAETAQRPKANISWEDAQNFIKRLNQQTTGHTYRLPTEAEWEYACLAGGSNPDGLIYTAEYSTNLKSNVWFGQPKRGDPEPKQVGQLPANAWGLYDMLGNLWEWTADEYQSDGYQYHPRTNPLLDNGGPKRVIRGGSYLSEIYHVRCSARSYGIPNDPLSSQGLRIVREKEAH